MGEEQDQELATQLTTTVAELSRAREAAAPLVVEVQQATQRLAEARNRVAELRQKFIDQANQFSSE